MGWRGTLNLRRDLYVQCSFHERVRTVAAFIKEAASPALLLTTPLSAPIVIALTQSVVLKGFVGIDDFLHQRVANHVF